MAPPRGASCLARPVRLLGEYRGAGCAMATMVATERRSAQKRPRQQQPRRGGTAAPEVRAPKKPELIIDCKYVNELPQPPVPKLLKALPSADRLCRYEPSQLELDCRPFLLSEQELLTRLELVDPDAYGEAPAEGSMPPPPPPKDAQLLRDDDVSAEVKIAETKRRRLYEKTEAHHRQAFGLQLPQLVTNDIFTERQRYITGCEATEKKLSRPIPGYSTVEELANKIEGTFIAANQPPVHPSNPNMKPKRILDLVPDAVLWANRYRQVLFDEVPKGPERNDLLFKTAPTPRVTCFGYFSPAPDGEPGTYRLAENYFWENRGGFTKESEVGEGEAMLISFPTKEEPRGEARFVTVPTYMKLRKQKAFRLDINLDTKVLNVTHRDPSAQEAQEEQKRMEAVLSDEVRGEKSEASLDFYDGEWHFRGDPRSASGMSKKEEVDGASGDQNGTQRDGGASVASGMPALPITAGVAAPSTPIAASSQATAASPGRP